MTHTITHDKEGCIGCGACVAMCSDNWEMGNDGKSKPKKTTIEDSELECNQQAANACPVKVIHID